MRKFHLGDILSIITGRLLSPRHMEGVYDILSFMTGEELYTHQLGRAKEECAPYLLTEMPWLRQIDPTGVTPDNWKEWLDQQVQKYGEWHDVLPIHPDDHEIIDPIEELKRMGIDESRIITIGLTDQEQSPPPYGDISWKSNEE